MKLKTIVFFLIVLLLVGGSLFAAWYFYREAATLRSQAADMSADELADIVTQVAGYMELPSDETPTLATVVNREELQDQAFFLNAQNGDKVLIYTNARKAILYRPESKKIIEVAPIFFSEEPPADSQTQEDTPEDLSDSTTTSTIRIAVYNAATIPGRDAEIGTLVEGAFDNIEIVGTIEAIGAYTGVTVVDASGQYPEAAAEMTTLLGGTLGTLPPTETPIDADILLIIGA